MLHKNIFVSLLFFIGLSSLEAQEITKDSIMSVSLGEVVLITPSNAYDYRKQSKPLAGLDQYLESARHIQMIKRGAYAWEPSLHNMSSERLSLTIDGMHIFEACADKMDPITSYVSGSNLQEAQIGSGQDGSLFGNAIGGGINLKVKKGSFDNLGMTGGLESGWESNSNQSILGGNINYSSNSFYANANASHRKASNYKAGGNKKIDFSQFEKYNIALHTGYKLTEDKSLHASIIFDEARNVGYPALTMDVASAQAQIYSLQYNQKNLGGSLVDWETKLYANTIKHVMDDTKRPEVDMHMDMPGWSDTYGFYTQAFINKDNHRLFFKIDGYYNKSLAEMTMEDHHEEDHDDYDTGHDDHNGHDDHDDHHGHDMHMLTWPNVHTSDVGFYAEDKIDFGMSYLKLSTRLAYHNNTVKDADGLHNLQELYPDADKSKTRFLKSFSAQYHKMLLPFHIDVGIAYGDRAPSVTEGYGYYIFNTFDNYDYIGNPNLKNESALETNFAVTLERETLTLELGANYFHIYDYIVGKPTAELHSMSTGAAGVKMYENLKYAQQFSAFFSAKYRVLPYLDWSAQVNYNYGKDNDGNYLPLISPLTYQSSLDFHRNLYHVSFLIEGADKQSNYGVIYGEGQTAGYTIISASAGKDFYLNKDVISLNLGIENILDKEYATYSDWNNIPRPGRNIYVNLMYAFK